VEKSDDGVLIIKRIHVEFKLTAAGQHRPSAERAHGIYADRRPLYRSVKACIAVTSGLTFIAD
jgi:hypothetical protein